MSVFNLLFLVYQVIVILMIIGIVMDNRQPVKTMAWALVIWFVPVAGMVLYLFFGTNTRKMRLVSRRSMDQLTKRSMLGFAGQQNLKLPDAQKPIIDLFVNQNFSLPFQARSVAWLTSGLDFFPRLLSDIAQARSHIHIDMYIFEDDALGRLLSDALIDKARAGIEVRLIYDDVGCWSVKSSFFERMRIEGIEVVPFLPVRFPKFTSKANYRNHRKLIVIDGHTGYIGGMNVALRYADKTWRDTMVRVTGSVVYSLQRAFLIDWYFVDRTLLSDRKYYPESLNGTDVPYAAIAQTVTSSPAASASHIMQGYVRVIMQARNYIYIQTPYFLPTEPVLFALKTAAQGGIDVRLMVPRRSDARFVEWAGRSYLREAVEEGVRVLLYDAGFLHSKFLVCDDMIATCGSTNVDFRSFENNFEANIFVYGEQPAVALRNIFLADEQKSTPLADIPGRMRARFSVRLAESLARLLSPLL